MKRWWVEAGGGGWRWAPWARCEVDGQLCLTGGAMRSDQEQEREAAGISVGHPGRARVFKSAPCRVARHDVLKRGRRVGLASSSGQSACTHSPPPHPPTVTSIGQQAYQHPPLRQLGCSTRAGALGTARGSGLSRGHY